MLMLIPAPIYEMVKFSEDIKTLLDPQMLKVMLKSFTLQMKLANSKLVMPLTMPLAVGNLKVQIRLGRLFVEKEIKPIELTVDEGPAGRVTSFLLDEQVGTHLKIGLLVKKKVFSFLLQININLAGAFDVAYNFATKKKDKEEVSCCWKGSIASSILPNFGIQIGDIRIYLVREGEIIGRTQLPIC